MKGKVFAMVLLYFLTAATAAFSAAVEEAPTVVVSIKPIHSLVAAVMEGVGEPHLLVKGSSSPHSYTMRPSDARAIVQAKLVVWVGENLESFLEKPLATLGGGAVRLKLTDALKDHLLPVRSGGPWEEHEHVQGHGDEDGHRGEEPVTADPHLWLDPIQAARIVDLLVPVLGRIDPAHAQRYRKNGERLKGRLDTLRGELQHKVEPVKDVPYVVFHDAYQYFEAAYGLDAVGSITIGPERRPGARRISRVREKIKAMNARCVFSEPQFEPRLIATVIEGTGARKGVLDPLGAGMPAGPETYFLLMNALADNLVACLERE